jgi:hypothetical protein
MPPKRKRNAEDDADISDGVEVKPSKKSKREMLAEARARAKLWADEELTKKQTVTSTPVKVMSMDQENRVIKSAVNKVPETIPSTSTKLKMEISMAVPPQPKVTAAAVKTATTTNSLERKRAEARARAKAWAAQEELATKLHTMNSSISPSPGHALPKPVDQTRSSEDEEDDDETMCIAEKSNEQEDSHENEESNNSPPVGTVVTKHPPITTVQYGSQLRPTSSSSEVRARLTNADYYTDTQPGSDDVVTKNILPLESSPNVKKMVPLSSATKLHPIEYSLPPFSLPFGSPVRKSVTEQRRLQETKKVRVVDELLPPNFVDSQSHKATVETPGENDDKNIEAMIHKQVLVNALAFHEIPSQSETAVIEEPKSNSVVSNLQEPLPKLSALSSRHVRMLLLVSILCGLIATFFILTPEILLALKVIFPASLATVISNLPPCFGDKDVGPDEALPPDTFRYLCDETLPKTPCPDNGRCLHGTLFHCNGRHLQVSSDASQCVLDAAANATVQIVESLISNWTITYFCSMDGVSFARESNIKAKATFPLKNVTKLVKADTLLLWLSNSFVIENIDSEQFIGLSDSYFDSKFSLPPMCSIGLATLDLVLTLMSNVFFGALRLFSAFFTFGTMYPLVSLICLISFLIIQWTRNRENFKRKLISDVAMVRGMAYDRLMSDCLEHAILHLRDGIAMDLHPMSKEKRSYIILKVWPRVVADIRLDNRVAKTNRVVAGKSREVWQWVAASNTKTRRSNLELDDNETMEKDKMV